MKVVIQRVLSASVSVDSEIVGSINQGLLILLGVVKEDVLADLNYLVKKTIGLRIFKDEDNNMNRSIKDIGGEALVISQFTLCANTDKGLRPSFINAAPSGIAENTYKIFCEKLLEKKVVAGSSLRIPTPNIAIVGISVFMFPII